MTRIERFQIGDYPMVCVASGLPATELVPVQARRTTVWPWFLLAISAMSFVLAKLFADTDHPWGRSPFVEGHVAGVGASYDKAIGVIIDGIHPAFVRATRETQGVTS